MEGRDGKEVGWFGLENRNERGSKLGEYYRRKMVITNTWFTVYRNNVTPGIGRGH